MITLIIAWVLSGIIAAGFFNAYLRGKFQMLDSEAELRRNLMWSLGIGIFGPGALIVSIPGTEFCKYGWTLRYKK